jgi:hypothetical protein
MPASPASWKALADLLEARRIELDPRYDNFTLFCEERQVNFRLAWDIEHARRSNFRNATLLGIEEAYGLAPRSIRRFLDYGAPLVPAYVPLDEPEDDRPAVVRDHWDDTNVQALWLLAITPAQKLSLIETYLEEADAAQRGA